eukprot:m.198937 g.198937  ORF g.198937 m.198937 type:complete len:304 (+) comp20610_c0_seq1:29-940(+)
MSAGPNRCGANGAGLPPPWLTGDMERPAGEVTDGSARYLVYTDEQQARLGVDAQGNKTVNVNTPTATLPPTALPPRDTSQPLAPSAHDPPSYPSPSPLSSTSSDIPPSQPLHCGGNDLRPRWLREGLEPPAGEKNMGTWTKAVYTEEQQNRLGVREDGEPYKLINGPLVKPHWIEAGLEPPAGEVNMGTWIKAVYTKEQQKRLGVDEDGRVPDKANDATASLPDAVASLGLNTSDPGSATASATVSETAAQGPLCKDSRPRWVKNGTEPPAGRKDMGGWEMGVFTEEQQARLNVDEKGNPKSK